MKISKNISSLLQEFFTEYLINQRQASQHTIASYRDTFCLLFRYAKQRYKKLPVALVLSELNATFISEFLNHLEKDRGVSARTRNQRLAAIRSFFRYISLYVPEEIALIQQVLAIPNKRCLKDVITQLEPGLFKKVTGLTMKDFELLVSLGLFNSALMNDAVYKFKRYEDASLSYTGIDRHESEEVGLYDTVLSATDYQATFVNEGTG